MNKAVFLDRDGTLNKDDGYTYKTGDLEFLPHVVEGLKVFQEKGYALIIVTNQNGVAQGYYSSEDVEKFNQKMVSELEKEGVKISGYFYCTHGPEDNCACRKPKTKLVTDAAEKFDIDVSQSIFIGDKTTDIATGKKAGCKTILVLTGHAGEDGKEDVAADHTCVDLLEASSVV